VHDKVQVDVAVGVELEGDTETAAKVGDGPPDAAHPADVEPTEEEGTEVAEGEPEVPHQECSVGHFNMPAELPIPTMLVESYTTTTAPSCVSQFEILGNTNDGKCNTFGCCNPVFIACHICNEFLCHDHAHSACSAHSHAITLPVSFCDANVITVVVDETGEEFQVPVERVTCHENDLTSSSH